MKGYVLARARCCLPVRTPVMCTGSTGTHWPVCTSVANVASACLYNSSSTCVLPVLLYSWSGWSLESFSWEQ